MYHHREISDIEYISVLQGRIEQIEPCLNGFSVCENPTSGDLEQMAKMKSLKKRYERELEKIND